MSKTLTEIAQQLRDASKKVQLIYAFNGTGKTRLSCEFQELMRPTGGEGDSSPFGQGMALLYYNAFTEDLFYWDNDLEEHKEPVLNIEPNAFTSWVLKDQGQDQNIIDTFQRYTNDKLTPRFDEYFSEVAFSFERGNDELTENIKISKGEESCFIWSVFYTLIEAVRDILNDSLADRETDEFDDLQYVFVDDPVSSLDENYLIEFAVDLAQLIKKSTSEVKFIVTTHSPLFYNVLSHELKRADKYILQKKDDGGYDLSSQDRDCQFSYHLYLKDELERAIETDQIRKYHFNFLRNILEKTATFLGYKSWGDLLPRDDGNANLYKTRIMNISSHSRHAGEEIAELTDTDKSNFKKLVRKISETYHFQ